ncbi:MAG: hypothetical protein [Caudoviricetes sp.]|nr:MAG: hypothetical protein [Caudoviricetes sp.]
MANEYYEGQTFQGRTFGDDLIFENCTFTPVNTFGDNVRFVNCIFTTGEDGEVNTVNGYAIVSGGTLNSTVFLSDSTVSDSTVIGVEVTFANRLQNRVEYGGDVEGKIGGGGYTVVTDFDGNHIYCNPCTIKIHEETWKDNK